MNPHVEDGLQRLNAALPLYPRQRQLTPRLIEAHRAILNGLARQGRVPDTTHLGAILGDEWQVGLEELAALDLVVLSQGRLAGAYPITEEPTPHRVAVFGNRLHAMCALDALSVATLFETHSRIESQCAVSAQPVVIEQHEDRILSADPDSAMVGIRWQQICGHAAHSLCMEMVFLKDAATAADWQSADPPAHSLYTLAEAVEFGRRFFVPLLRPD